MSLTHEQILETVQRSPALVAAQDKAAWIALFSSDGTVEDPVGGAVNRRGGNVESRTLEDELSRFWDTFIAGNEIRFEVRADRLGASELARDVVIHTRLSTGMTIDVPAYLLYEVVLEQGAPRIQPEASAGRARFYRSGARAEHLVPPLHPSWAAILGPQRRQSVARGVRGPSRAPWCSLKRAPSAPVYPLQPCSQRPSD